VTATDHQDSTHPVLSPFTVGDTEFLLVPNQREGSEVNVMLITQRGGEAISSQLPLSRARELARLLQAAADEAEQMAGYDTQQQWQTSPHNVVKMIEEA